MSNDFNPGWNRWAAIGLAIVAMLIAVGIGTAAYQAGVAHGLALHLPEAGATPPFAYYGWYGWHRPWGFGLFAPFFFIFFWFVLLRAFFWGGRRRWHYRYWDDRHRDDVPARFEEWHRKAHEQMKPNA
jgi:hypothetical protein